jgi:hypothetical protein
LLLVAKDNERGRKESEKMITKLAAEERMESRERAAEEREQRLPKIVF